jgi:hypothetical protein
MALSSARAAVLRSFLLFAPFLAVAIVALVYLVLEVSSDGLRAGLAVAIAIVGVITALLTYQVVQSFRDLFSQLVQTEGVIERKWSRSDILIFKNDYVFVNGTVFRIEPEHAIRVNLGDTVRLVHYPHTGTVDSVEVLPREAAETTHV